MASAGEIRPLNKCQKEQGVLPSAAVVGKLEFSKLKMRVWRDALVAELIARGHTPTDVTQSALRKAF